MTAYYLDSSALVKRYATESGSGWLRAITVPRARNVLVVARITWVEVLSALMRRQREGALAPGAVTGALRAFRYDLDTQYQVVELDRLLAELAGDIVQRHALRTYDAVQLAAALRIGPAFAGTGSAAFRFVTADDRLLAIARLEGLSVDNPNNHP